MIYGFGVLYIGISDLVSDLRFWVYLQHLVSYIVVSVVAWRDGRSYSAYS